LRALARLLTAEQYVLPAEGRTGAALESYAVSLRLARVYASRSLLHGLSATAVRAAACSSIARHLDQLAAADCDTLLLLGPAELALPSLARVAFRGERELVLSSLV
jgi:hypothetical protein